MNQLFSAKLPWLDSHKSELEKHAMKVSYLPEISG